jgi:hypothetical protein
MSGNVTTGQFYNDVRAVNLIGGENVISLKLTSLLDCDGLYLDNVSLQRYINSSESNNSISTQQNVSNSINIVNNTNQYGNQISNQTIISY